MNSPVGFQHPKGLCYVSEELKLIFVPVPKNASTSVRRILSKIGEFSTGNIMSYADRICTDEFRAFSIIRDPLDRFVSGYLEVCRRASQDSPHILMKDFYWLWRDQRRRFLRFLEELECGWFDAHMFPQSYFLKDYGGKPFKLDAYIDMRNIEMALPSLLHVYGIELDAVVPRENVSSDRKKAVFFSRLRDQGGISGLQRNVYLLLDSALRFLQRRPAPSSSMIRSIIAEQAGCFLRIKKILGEDMNLLEEIREKAVQCDRGIYWMR